MHRAHACERAYASTRVVHIHLSLDGSSSNLLGTYYKDHKLHGLHTYYIHAPRARVRARVIKLSFIYGRFAVNMLQITTRSMGFLLFMFTHRAHAFEHACAISQVVKRARMLTTRACVCLLIFERIVCECIS
jgi:hypothetical protein